MTGKVAVALARELSVTRRVAVYVPGRRAHVAAAVADTVPPELLTEMVSPVGANPETLKLPGESCESPTVAITTGAADVPPCVVVTEFAFRMICGGELDTVRKKCFLAFLLQASTASTTIS